MMPASSERNSRIVRVVRGLSFLIGLVGLAWIICSVWLDIPRIGGLLCLIGVIGHIVTWQAYSSVDPNGALERDRRL